MELECNKICYYKKCKNVLWVNKKLVNIKNKCKNDMNFIQSVIKK